MTSNTADLAMCATCGTQFDVPLSSPPKSCHICDDPRQYVPPTGQKWTSLTTLRAAGHQNIFTPILTPSGQTTGMTGICTHPKVAINQRAILLETPAGNVLWDMIGYLDDDTIRTIEAKGGLQAIVISHPHYYTTHLEWAAAFKCPVYLAAEDEEWHARKDVNGVRRFIKGEKETIVEGVTALKLGGHFDGSLVLHWEDKLLIADTLMTAPSALYFIDRRPGTTSFTFMYSIPNMIPLPPTELQKIWRALKEWDFDSTHGAFDGMDVWDVNVKARVLESMKIQARSSGWKEGQVEILKEEL